MYAGKISIDYKPKKITYVREVELPDGLLTIDEISKHINDGERFSFDKIDDIKQDVYYLIIQGSRYETNDELKERVEKEERYNVNYADFNKRYRK